MDMLLLSNSRSDQGYLVHAMPWLRQYVEDRALQGKSGVLLPYARVATSWDDATASTNAAFAPLGVTLTGLHTVSNPIQAVQQAAVIVVPGGNTFNLLRHTRDLGLLPAIEKRVRDGA